MAFTFSNLAYKIWSDLGKIDQFHEFLATGGSTTTVANSAVSSRADQPEDNYSIDYTAIVVRDAGGASAAPEGELQRINAYNSSTYTHTLDTAVSTAIASGDKVAIANSDIPLYEMYRICNRALTELGDIALVDTSLTSASMQTEYALPVALKREDLFRVEVQGRTGDADDNRWLTIHDWEIRPAAPGSTALLILPQLSATRTIKIVYKGVHPELTAYSSTISENIHPHLAIAAGTAHALQWYNRATGGNSPYWMQAENKAWQDLENARLRFPITMPRKAARWFTVNSPLLEPSAQPNNW